jgi:Arc/MetJ-type ribon-helix-helix transcriptional regulator
MYDQLPTDVTQTIQSLLATGRYRSEEDVLRHALDALQHRDDDAAAIAAGIADMEAGRCEPFEKFDAEFRKRNNIPDAE